MIYVTWFSFLEILEYKKVRKIVFL